MADFGSYHSSPENSDKPSLFQVLAQENLASNLRAAFRHIVKVLAENFPQQFGFTSTYFEELYTISDFIFQYIHLRAHGATLPEHFYGLKRKPNPKTSAVSEKLLLHSLFWLVVFPYIRMHLENVFKHLKGREANGDLQHYQGFTQNTAVVYLRSYPLIHLIWEMTGLCYSVAFAVNKSNYCSPILHFSGTQLENANGVDLETNLWEKNFTRSCSAFLWKWAKSCVSSVTLGISVGAFFLQFLEWWQNREGVTTFNHLPIPPPPAKWPLDVPSHICPLCKKMRTNDAALKSSGFVFCYPCIYKYVKDNQKCPVTGYPSQLNQILRIYCSS